LTKEAKHRAVNPYSPEVRYPPEGRTSPSLGRFAWLVPPGTYTVTLSAGGREEKQPLVLRKDPASGGSEEEIRASTALATEIARDVNSVVDMSNALEVVRGQIAALKGTLGDDSATADVRSRIDSLDRELVAVEEELFQVRTTGRGQDLIRYPFKLGEQLIYLGNSVVGSDYGPTAQHREVQGVLQEKLRQVRTLYDQVMTRDVEAFRQLLRSRNLQNAIIS
jgi:hypothetical protein